MDTDYWGDPEVFRPSRFLIKNGQSFKLDRKEQFIPFGFGKRVCMGENFAKAELWLFFTSILQRFTVKKPRENPLPDPRNDIAGLTRSPEPFYVQFEARH